MVKLKNPLLSLGAVGNITKAITFVRRRRTNIVEAYPEPKQPNTSLQLEWRHMYQKAVALWHALSATEKQEWESLARAKHMTGFAWFVSQALKPNPGLYLPLQGGTMQGTIEMADHHIHGLPIPAHAQDPLRVFEYNSAIAPFLYHEGARVYHNAAQSIPHNTFTALAFNSERWDNDTIHDTVVNNSRLTCKTAGKYLVIAYLRWATNATGYRQIQILDTGGFYTANSVLYPSAVWVLAHNVPCIVDLAVNDYVEVWVRQTSGGALNVEYSAEFSPEFMMERIGV